MKTKDIKRMLIEKTERDIPDVLDRIHLETVRIEPKQTTAKRSFTLRRGLSMTFAALVIFFGFFFGYTWIDAPSTGPNTTPLASETEEITFQTVSATALLDSESLDQLNGDLSAPSIMQLNDDEDEDDDDETVQLLESEMDIINRYMNMLESTIGNKNQMLFEQGPSDREGYETMVTYKNTDLLGNLVTYTLHLNIETSEDRQTFTGIMLLKEKQYEVNGETITEDGEKKTSFTASVDEDNYVYSETELEDDEQSYRFEMYKNGTLDHQSEVKIEMDDDEITSEINIESANHSFKLEIGKDFDERNEPGFRVSFEFENGERDAEGEFRVTVGQNTAGASVYRYHINDQDIERGRSDKGSRKATEDDFRGQKDDDDDEDDENNGAVTTTEPDDEEDSDDHPGQGPSFPFDDDDDDGDDEEKDNGRGNDVPGPPFDDDDDEDDENDEDTEDTTWPSVASIDTYRL